MRGRTVDVHSLRHTFATMLSQAGVLPRMAQEFMRKCHTGPGAASPA